MRKMFVFRVIYLSVSQLLLVKVKLKSSVAQSSTRQSLNRRFFRTDKAQLSLSSAGRPESDFQGRFLSRTRPRFKGELFGREGVERWELSGGQRAQWSVNRSIIRPVHQTYTNPSSPDSAFFHFILTKWAWFIRGWTRLFSSHYSPTARLSLSTRSNQKMWTSSFFFFFFLKISITFTSEMHYSSV